MQASWQLKVDPRLVKPPHKKGGVLSKSDESPLKGDPPEQNQPGVLLNPGLTLVGGVWKFGLLEPRYSWAGSFAVAALG